MYIRDLMQHMAKTMRTPLTSQINLVSAYEPSTVTASNHMQMSVDNAFMMVTRCNMPILQDKGLEGQVVSATDKRLWHGTSENTAWVAAQGLLFPRICVNPGFSPASFASDSQQDPVLAEGFAQALRDPQRASFSSDFEGELWRQACQAARSAFAQFQADVLARYCTLRSPACLEVMSNEKMDCKKLAA